MNCAWAKDCSCYKPDNTLYWKLKGKRALLAINWPLVGAGVFCLVVWAALLLFASRWI